MSIFYVCLLGGHHLSQRLSKQITACTSSLKVFVLKYNHEEWNEHPRQLTLQDVFCRDMAWLSQGQESSTAISTTIKNKLIHVWTLRDRATEEVELLKHEMMQTISSAITEQETVSSFILDNHHISKGVLSLCKQLLLQKAVVYFFVSEKFCFLYWPYTIIISLYRLTFRGLLREGMELWYSGGDWWDGLWCGAEV